MATTNSIQYIFELIDKYSPILNRIKRSNKQFYQTIERANARLKKMSATLKSVGRTMGKLGKKMMLKVTAPILAFGANAIRLWNKQEQAITQVRVGLESTKAISGKTLDELINNAKKLQSETIFGDETILAGVTAQLLTFTNIANDQFDRTQQVVLDVATRLSAARGGMVDLTSTSIMLGKALNDPIANLGALGRSGIQFTKGQKQVIKVLTESGRLADAQAMILKELEKQYGGTAKAMANVGTGPLKQMLNILGDTNESLGKLIFKRMEPLIDKVKEWIISFDNLSPKTKEMILLIAGIAAAIAPLLLVLAGVTFALGILISPIGLVVAGIAALSAGILFLVIKWNKLKKTITESKPFIFINEMINVVARGIKNLIDSYDKFVNIIRFNPVSKAFRGIKNFFGEQISAITTNNFSGAMDINLNAPKGVVSQVKTTQRGKNFKLGTNMKES